MKLYTVKSSANRAAKQAGLTKDQYEIIEVDGKFGYQEIVQEDVIVGTKDEIVREEPKAKKAPVKKIERLNVSSIELPTKRVWHVADEMFDAAEAAGEPQPKRKDVIAHCVEMGIAYNTARTQYQQWWACRNGNLK